MRTFGSEQNDRVVEQPASAQGGELDVVVTHVELRHGELDVHRSAVALVRMSLNGTVPTAAREGVFGDLTVDIHPESRRPARMRVQQPEFQPAGAFGGQFGQPEPNGEGVSSLPRPGIRGTRLGVGPFPFRIGNADNEERILLEPRVAIGGEGKFGVVPIHLPDAP